MKWSAAIETRIRRDKFSAAIANWSPLAFFDVVFPLSVIQVDVLSANIIGVRRVGVATAQTHPSVARGDQPMICPWRWGTIGMSLQPATLRWIEDPGVVRQVIQMIAAEQHIQPGRSVKHKSLRWRSGTVFLARPSTVDRPRSRFGVECLRR